jgi:Capsule polysaccharide export protein
MEETKKKPEVIDLRVITKKIWTNKKLFYRVLPIVFIVSCVYILSLPRYYSTNIKLAPETESSGAGSTLGSIAASFGFDISDMQTSDAITPLLYPDLMEDNGFVAKLLKIHVVNQSGDIKTNYHDYLTKYQKKSWWAYPIKWIKNLLLPKEDEGGDKNKYNPYYLSKKEDAVLVKARDYININIDKKTGVISINVEAQDPLICKTLADSIKDQLQFFITDYRTNKARIDYEYYKQLSAEAKQDYERLRQRYGAFVDGNVNIAMQSIRLKAEEMESEMELKFSNYNTLNSQMLAAKAKIQERTPAFTVIKGANVPIKPAGPKRMIFVALMLVLTCVILSLYSIRDIIFKD